MGSPETTTNDKSVSERDGFILLLFRPRHTDTATHTAHSPRNPAVRPPKMVSVLSLIYEYVAVSVYVT